MGFSITPLEIRSVSLNMDYYLVPWDSEILSWPAAEVSHIEVKERRKADVVFSEFTDWCKSQNIRLCSCRINSDHLDESFFLQDHGFQFVELNYRPNIFGLQQVQLPVDSIEIVPAQTEDQEALGQIASQVFRHGRFHQDPALGRKIGNERYRAWMLNSFSNPIQIVFKCMVDGKIAGFFVVEYPEEKSCHWSLNGLAPDYVGSGMGTRIWNAMMRFHQREGMESITTSISSHNAPALNLYAKLGFRFPLPLVTFHWHL